MASPKRKHLTGVNESTECINDFGSSQSFAYFNLFLQQAVRILLQSCDTHCMIQAAIFFTFNVFLPSFDIGTDLATSLEFFSTQQYKYGLATLLPIFAPFSVRLVQTLLEMIQNWKKDQSQLVGHRLIQLAWHLPFLHPIK